MPPRLSTNMRCSSRLLGAFAAAVAVLPSALGQNSAPVTITDAGTGIVFNTWGLPNGSPQTQGGFTFGVALPSNALTTDASEFIGYLVRLVKGHRSDSPRC